MPVDIGRRQTIEEITDGRIKKRTEEKPTSRTAGRGSEAARPEAARKAGRSTRR